LLLLYIYALLHIQHQYDEPLSSGGGDGGGDDGVGSGDEFMTFAEVFDY